MRKKFKQGKWVMLMLALAVWCIGCSGSGSDDSTSSEQGGEFHPTPPEDVQARIEDLKLLLPEETYNIITEKSRNDPRCRERNREELDLPDKPNGQWYYTYENLIKGMAEWKEFANEGDENTRKLEIAAFLANVAQETGAGKLMDPTFGGPGCFIQEGDGAKWGTDEFSRDCKKPTPPTCAEAGYCGRGPHQLSWDYNYKAFGEDMDPDDKDKYFNDPDLLTKYPEIGIAGSIWFWGHADLGSRNDPGKPFKPSAHNVAVGNVKDLLNRWEPTDADKECGRTKADFGVIINIINGGVECGPGADNAQAAKNRLDYFKAIAAAMGLTIPDDDPFLDDCSTQKNFAKCVSYPDPTSRCGKDWADADNNCRDCCSSNDDCPAEYPNCIGKLSNPTPDGETCSCGN